MPKSTLSFEQLMDKLEYFKTQIASCDHTHDQTQHFALMKAFRRFVASVHDADLCHTFFHSPYYEGYKEFFRDCNNYYVRAMETIEALSIMSRGEHGKKDFLELIDAEQIKYNYQMKGEDLEAVEFTSDKKLVMVGC